jgi:hypothetical protein
MISSFTQIDNGSIFPDLRTDDDPRVEDRIFFEKPFQKMEI